MAARVVLSADAWAAVRAAYEGRDETVGQIVVRFGIQKHHLYYRADREGWRKRTEIELRTAGDVPPPAVRFVPAAGLAADDSQAADHIPAVFLDEERPAETHVQRVERLHRIIDRLLMKLERTMANNPNMSPQDQEKTARAVTQTVAAMERVTELANT